MTDFVKLIADRLRPVAPGGKVLQAEMPAIRLLAEAWQARLEEAPAGGPGVAVNDPPWTVAARKLIGLREVPGPQHNPTILSFWKLRGGLPIWGLKTDEDPWCGGFMAWAMKEAGLDFPREYPRAASWRTFGVACSPQVGAIGVKSRSGGNHVFQIVGITADRKRFKALGGNQSNGVNIIDIAVDQTDAIRWPAGVPQRGIPLPVMPAGTIGASEA